MIIHRDSIALACQCPADDRWRLNPSEIMMHVHIYGRARVLTAEAVHMACQIANGPTLRIRANYTRVCGT